MKKYTFSLLLIGGMTFAQKLTIEETVTGGRKFAPSTQLAQQWRKNSKAITYLSSDFSNLLEKSASNGWKETILTTKHDFEKALKTKINSDDFLLRSFPMSIEWKSIDTFETEISGKKIIIR
nr:hypothetical protein [Flavobacterium covae]